jgi:ribosomal protein S18 acetylase RimI-like enzyme
MKVRDFVPQDLEKICSFKTESSRCSFPNVEIDMEVFKRNLLASLQKTDRIKVIEDEESGSVIAYVRFGTKKTVTGMHGVIKHTFVDAAHRGKGLATMLMKDAESHLKSMGVSTVRTEVTYSNTPSIGMNRKLGYKEKRIIFEKEI